MPKIFGAGRSRPSPAKHIEPQPRQSFRERGYDSKWSRRSLAIRRRHPFCALCMEKGRPVFGDLVDHKFPVSDGGAVHCPDEGLWVLCTDHHNWKARLEAHARETNQMHMLVRWCDDPEIRPRLRGDIG